jgi:hypothetical protein
MEMKKLVFIALILTIASASVSFAGKQSKNKAIVAIDHFDQIIQTTNLLVNTNLDSQTSTASPVLLQYYIGSDVVWDATVRYKKFDDFGVCKECGIKEKKVTKVVITPQPPNGKKQAIYFPPYTVNIETDKISTTQIIILQKDAPTFKPNSGEVDKYGTIQVITQSK